MSIDTPGSNKGRTGAYGPAGPAGNGGTAHVDQATIDVSQATIVQTPQARRQSRYLAYALVVLFLFTIILVGGSYLFQSGQVHTAKEAATAANSAAAAANRNAQNLRQQVIADCGFYRDLAGLPVTPAAGGHPSELGIKIVLDSRASFYGHQCPGQIPALSASVRAGAAFYHLPIPQPQAG